MGCFIHKTMNTKSAEELLDILRNWTSDDWLDQSAYELFLLKEERATPILLSRLQQTTEPWLRERLVSALGILQNHRAADTLLAIFNSPEEHSDVKESAALGLGWIKERRAVQPLIQALATGDSHLAFACAVALGHIQDEAAIEVLIQALNFNSLLFPQAAAEALGNFGALAKPALPHLREIANNGNEVAKRFALEAITKIEADLNNPRR
jgi:HEAT repeat protein